MFSFEPHSKSAEYAICPRARVGDVAGDAQVQFGTGPRLAPDFEFGADPGGALFQAYHSPVAEPSAFLEHFGINPDAIVAKANAKTRFPKGYFGFDSARLGVLKRIAQRLLGNAKNLRIHPGVQLLRRAFNNNSVIRRMICRLRILFGELSHHFVDSLCDVRALRVGAADILDGVATLSESSIRVIECVLKNCFGFLWAIGQKIVGGLEAEHESLEALQQRVMQFLRD